MQLVLVIGDRLTSGYETSILDIAEHFDLPCVNFVSDPISRIDSTHPDAKGHEQIARKIYDSCKDCLKSASDSELPPVTVPEGELPQSMGCIRTTTVISYGLNQLNVSYSGY